MEIFRDETEFTDIRAVQRVVDLFEGRPRFQRIVRLGLMGMEYDDEQDFTDEDDYGTDDWVHGHNNFHGYPRFSGSHSRSSSSVYQLPQHYYTTSCEIPHPPPVTVRTRESSYERKLLGKAERKRLKKQKRKERRRLERLKEEQNTIKKEEGKDDAKQSEAGESKDNDESGLKLASAKGTDSSGSSEEESSDEDGNTDNDSEVGDSEQLDMESTFVSKAAHIARRKLEQKTTPEKKEKKKIPVNEEPKTLPNKPNEDTEVEKKDSASTSSPTFQDNVKISTDLAIIGNRFASAGDFNMAVKYFTDAIKYNPTEYKLFGNRSFCFEKLQEYEKALLDAELSLSMWPGWVKGLFRRGRALAGLKRYEEAAQAFREVLKLDSSYAEAAQELMRVQITQLMEYGFTREQSSNALIIHGTLKKALEVLSKLNCPPGVNHSGALQLANVTGVSPVLSANTMPARPHNAQKTSFDNKPLAPNIQHQPKPAPNRATKANNQDYRSAEIGFVHSVKLLMGKRCAFVNFTRQEFCDEAIRRFHGSELNGTKIAVRYPDRIPQGMGISKAALKAQDLEDENMRQSEPGDGRNSAGSQRPFRPSRQAPDYRGNHNN